MKFDVNTKIAEILKQFPWLPEELVKIDSRFSIVNSPIGKMLIKNATVADLCGKAGIEPEDALKKLDELIASHKG
ncbi:hypothetical protein [uncultured Ruminococcus sp.]|uniref:hypothetical protein n=1 Tax=uncultured Ruminococcus sp. TaxID=165186 RepID=UPI00292EDDAC|nr:hypothetical protein [uncultured Ruminococcus sp.]